jgi:endonuclease G
MPFRKLLLLAALAVSAPAQHARFGLPACFAPHVEFAGRRYFLLCHDSDAKTSAWVGYELKPQQLLRVAQRPRRFRSDTALSRPGAADADYRHTGFSRGHLAPVADFSWSEEAVRATFLLSNAVPQRQRVNAGRWAQVEAAVRSLAARSDAAFVFTGPIFPADPARIGAGRVAVPSHLFKVVLAVKGDRKSMFAAIVPNVDHVPEPLAHFLTSVDEVERQTGLDFFSGLDDAEETELEAARGNSR